MEEAQQPFLWLVVSFGLLLHATTGFLCSSPRSEQQSALSLTEVVTSCMLSFTSACSKPCSMISISMLSG